MPPSYSIHLFGNPSVSDEAGKAVAGLGPGKPLALLSYLIVRGKTPRDEIIGLLWGDVPEARARNAFRQALHRLRSALGEDAIPHDPDHVFVAGGLSAATDVARFERFLEAGQPEQAIEEYAGDFLSGLDVGEAAFEEWRESVSRRYKAKYRDTLRALIQADTDSGDVARALRRSSALVATDALDVEATTLYASTLLGAGRRAEALQALENFERRYQLDFGTPAPRALREFLSRLRHAREDIRGTGPVRQEIRFVGRRAELSTLLTHLRALEGGTGSLVVIDGEAGAGKTRLIDEFFIRAHDVSPAVLLHGRERSPESAIPYASVAEALRGLLEAPGLAGTGQHLLAEAARLIPQLRDRFALPPISDISDDAGRLRFYEGVAALLDSVAYEQPVCLALDDFHNCSPLTFSLVAYLAERLRSAPILFLIAGQSTQRFSALRNELMKSVSRSASGRSGSEPAHLQLRSLDDQSARDLVNQMIDGGDDDAAAQDLISRTAGIPFRIIEACERLRMGEREEKNVVRLRDVLWLRLQGSTQAERRLFVTVALFDRAVSIRLLAAASHLPEKSALDAALALERGGLLLQRADGIVPAHDFSGEIALEGTGLAGRALLAGWAADALARDGSGSNAELARLFTLAGRRKEAFTYSRAAAFDAMKVGATDEANRHLVDALASAPTREERAELENLLQSLGGGHRRLPSAKKGPADPPAPHAGRPDSSSSDAISPRPAPLVKRNWSGRNIVTGIAALGATAVIVFIAFRAVSGLRRASIPGTSLADTLVVARELTPRDTVIAFATGQLGSALRNFEGATRHGLTRTWIDSLRLPWANASPSPDGRNVALERITKSGSQLFVISMDRRDTLQLRSGEGDDFSNGWSPDGRWLLATHGETRPDGRYAAELFGYSIIHGVPRIAFDTSRSSSVVEAVWSPDGSHVAWSSRVGQQRQRDIFVSDADGANVIDITNDPAEDYSIAWSPDGGTIAFTSERSGRAEIYSEDLATRELRRLTWEGAHADHAAFSPDGRWLAYESTRGGSPAVYVMPSGGGTGRNVASELDRVSLVGWRGSSVPYVDQIFAEVPPLTKPGDSGALIIRALDRRGNAMKVSGARVAVLDSNLIQLRIDSVTRPSDSIVIRALARGLARVSVSAGNWRADTAFVPIGQESLALLDEHFEGPLRPSIWRPLGDPTPVVSARAGSAGSDGLVARSDREWSSGLLSRMVIPVRSGLSADFWVSAPFTQSPAAKSFVVALVAADPAEVVDSIAPHFLRLAAISWVGEAGRVSYSVGGEIFTEPLSAIGAGDAHRFTMTVFDDDIVGFFVDGRLRWKSSLRVRTAGDNSHAQLWLGTQATGSSVVFDDVSVRLQMGRRVPR